MKVKILQKQFIKAECNVMVNNQDNSISRVGKLCAIVKIVYQEYFKTGREKGKPQDYSYTMYFDDNEELNNQANHFAEFGYNITTTHIGNLISEEKYNREKAEQKAIKFFDRFHTTELI